MAGYLLDRPRISQTSRLPEVHLNSKIINNWQNIYKMTIYMYFKFYSAMKLIFQCKYPSPTQIMLLLHLLLSFFSFLSFFLY